MFFVSEGFRDEYLEPFTGHSLRGLPWEDGRRRDFVGRFGISTEVVPDDRMRESDFYREWMLPQGLGPHPPLLHTIALDAGRPVAGLAIFAAQGGDPFTSEDVAFGDLLAPHLALGFRLLGEQRRHEALTDAVDCFPTGVVLLDARGQALLANRGARRILDQNDGLGLDGRTLRASTASDDATLHRLIAGIVEAALSHRLIESAVMTIGRRSGRRPYPLMVGPLRPHAGEPMLRDAVAVLYVSDLESGSLRRREALRELYGLTVAESHLVELLCQGSSLDEAAASRGVTMNTARSQLKQVFAKTHTSRQSELVRLVLSGVAPIATP